MSSPSSVAVEQPVERPGFLDVARDYVSLTKPRLSSLVLFTTFGGMWLSGHRLPTWTWVLTLVGTALTVGAANALNCVIERESDRLMARTARRPLPQRRLEAWQASAFAFTLGAIALPTLAVGVNALTGLLAAVALGSYVLVYTPLKSRTHWAMVAGAVPGALPPLMGWTAATGRIEAPGVVLFAILFVWQLPHTIAIALFRKEEYRAAGLTSLPLAKGDVAARWWAAALVTVLVPLSLGPTFVGVAGPLYAGAAVTLGAVFVWQAFVGAVRAGNAAWARRLFFTSLIHLTGLFIALAVDGGVRLTDT